MGYRELLRSQPQFRRLWLGQLVSQGGDWLQLIALLALFPTSGRGVELMAGVFIVRMMPHVLWMPIAGVVADRFRRGAVMVTCDLARAALVLCYLFVRDARDVVWIYALCFVQESLTAFFEPARSAALPQIVPARALLAANSLAGATWSAMLALGSAIGGALAAGVGARAAFVVNAVTFVVSALLIRSVRVPPIPGRAPGDAPPPRDRFGLRAVREGARYLAAHRAQATAALVKMLWGLCGGMVFLMPVYAGEVFARGRDAAAATGALYAGRGVGALFGPLIARRLLGESVPALMRGVLISFPAAALAYAAFAYAPSVGQAVVLLLIAHAGGSTVWVNSTQLLQLTVPNALQGRVFAVELAGVTGTMALSNWVAGAALGRGITDLRGATFGIVAAALGSGVLWALAMIRFGPRLEAAGAATIGKHSDITDTR